MQDHLMCEDEEKQLRSSGRKAFWEQSKFFYALQGLEAGRKYMQQFDVEDTY